MAHSLSIDNADTSGDHMERFRYFNDTTGQPVALRFVRQMRNEEFRARFPGVRGRRYDGFSMFVGYAEGATKDGQELPVTRCIDYKVSRPSLHICNAKCMGGKVNGSCECQCGGKNHGAGMFTSLLAA